MPRIQSKHQAFPIRIILLAVLKEYFEDLRALSYPKIIWTPCNDKELTCLIGTTDQANNHLLALKNLDEAFEDWDNMIVYLLSTKLDIYTKQEWEKWSCNFRRN